MIQLIGIGLVAVAGAYAWRALRREMARLDAEERQAKARPPETLEYDPATRRYRAPGAKDVSGR
jgi:hypothetical protein